MKHVFKGRTFEIKIEKIHGSCEDGIASEGICEIMLDSRDKGLEKLDTMIHESLHACFTNAQEKMISICATSISRKLWSGGVSESKKKNKTETYDYMYNIIWNEVRGRLGYDMFPETVSLSVKHITEFLIRMGYRKI